MQTPTKDRRLIGGAGGPLRGILQPQSPNHQLTTKQQQQQRTGSNSSFTLYRCTSRKSLGADAMDDNSSSGTGIEATALFATDSGYSSCLDSLWCPSVENSPSRSQHSGAAQPNLSSALLHQHHRLSCGSAHNNSTLPPILEGQELQANSMPVEMTPRTLSAQQRIAAFHISTPPSASSPAAVGSKRRLSAALSGEPLDSAAKTRRLQAPVTPSKQIRPRGLLMQRSNSRCFATGSPAASTSFSSCASGSFMDRLLGCTAAGNENNENQAPVQPPSTPPATTASPGLLAAFHADRMDFSPIHNPQPSVYAKNPKSAAGQARQSHKMRPTLFRRLASDHSLQSSTPIGGGRFGGAAAAGASNSQSLAARRMMRKTQSFSPSKLVQELYGQQQQRPAPLQPLAALPETRSNVLPVAAASASPAASANPANPARRLLAFPSSMFESLVSSKDDEPAAKRKLQREPAIQDISDSSICLFDQTAALDSREPRTPDKSHHTRHQPNLSIATSHDLLLNSSIICDDSPQPRPAAAATLASTSATHQLRQQRTPRKKMPRSFSLQAASAAAAASRESPGSAAARERNSILYARLPCTPPKSETKRRQQQQQQRGLLKRLSSTQLVRKSPVKRKLYSGGAEAEAAASAAGGDENCCVEIIDALPSQAAAPPPVALLLGSRTRRRYCTMDIDQLDVLGRLELVTPAVDAILQHLSTEDLSRMRQVCRRWRRIVAGNRGASQRVQQMERCYEVAKENGGGGGAGDGGKWSAGDGCGVGMVAAGSPEADVGAAGTVAAAAAAAVQRNLRKPFSRWNTIGSGSVDGGGHSPPVSPRSRAFNDNQTLVATLKTTQRLMKCPRCSRSSIIDRCRRPRQLPHHPQSTPNTTSNHHHTTTNNNNNHHVPSNTPKAAVPSLRPARLGLCGKQQSLPFVTPKPFETGRSIDASDSGFFGSISLHDQSQLMDATSGSHRQEQSPENVSQHGRQSLASGLEFGQCPSKQCGFRFCVDCLCEFDGLHEQSVAGDRCTRSRMRVATATKAPVSSKQSKRNLRRLGSLDV